MIVYTLNTLKIGRTKNIIVIIPSFVHILVLRFKMCLNDADGKQWRPDQTLKEQSDLDLHFFAQTCLSKNSRPLQ